MKATRREFLRSAAAAGAALGIPAGVFAEPATRGSEKQFRWGIIGAGHRGAIHINAIKSFDSSQIVAVCDVMENHLAAGIKRAGASVRGFSDYQKLLADRDINAVLIATPNCVHRDVLIAALEAGKHILCEKPMAVSVEECRAMQRAGEAHSEQVVLYTMQLRYSPRLATMRKAIEDGKIGRLRQMLFVESRGDWNRGDVWQFDDPKLGKVNWRFSHRALGGTLNEKVCHYFDILNWMAGGTPQRVSCAGGISVYNDGRDTWDHATTILHYEGGPQATHSLCMFGPKRLELQIVGEEASLLLSDAGLTLQSKGKAEPIELPDEIAHGERGPAKGQETAVVRMYEDFFDCVANRKKPWMDAEKAMASSRIAWLGEMSSERKQEVKWDDIG